MRISETIQDIVSQVYLEGRFDADTCGIVEQFVRTRMEMGFHCFVLNMEKVSFIGSAGLRIILDLAKELREEYQGDLRIVSLQPKVSKIFEISGVNNVMSIFEDMETATSSFTPLADRL